MLLGNSQQDQEPAPELDSQMLGWLWHDFPNSSLSSEKMCHQCQPRDPQSAPKKATCASKALTLGSAPVRGSGASCRPSLCMQGQQPPRLWTATHLHCRDLNRLGEGTSKHSGAQPYTGCGAATRELAGRDSEAWG